MHQRAPKITLLGTAGQKGAVNQVNFSLPKDHGFSKRLNRQVKDYKWDNNNNNNDNNNGCELHDTFIAVSPTISSTHWTVMHNIKANGIIIIMG